LASITTRALQQMLHANEAEERGEAEEAEECDEDEPEVIQEGEAVANNLESVLAVFPLHGKPRNKRPRSPIDLANDALKSILDPSDDDLLVNALASVPIAPLPLSELSEPSGPLEPVAKVAKQGRAFSSRFLAVLAKVPPRPRDASSANKPSPFDEDTTEYKYGEPNELGVQLVHPYTLFEYQLQSVKWCLAREREPASDGPSGPRCGGLLAMCMGLGKTVSAVTLISSTIADQRSLGSCSMYVCPKNLFGTVYHEVKKFFGSQLRIIIYHPDMLKSSFKTFGVEDVRKYDVIITNYETVKFSKCDAMAQFEWYRIVLDESHEIRNPKTKRFKAFMSLKTKRAICMSGTPLFNGLVDIVSQLRFTGFVMPPRMRVTEEVFKRLGLHQRIRFVEYTDATGVTLPTKKVHRIQFQLSPAERDLHTTFISKGRLHPLDDRYRYAHCMCALLRCMQVCTAPYIMTQQSKGDWDDVDDSDKVASAIDNAFTSDQVLNMWLHKRDNEAGVKSSKMQMFVNLVKSLPGEKIVVFSNFASSLQVAIAALVSGDESYARQYVHLSSVLKMHERDAALTAFRTKPNIRLLFVTMALGSNGLNLTESCKVIMLEPWYSYSRLHQAESRVHRIGQTREVDIYYLLAKDSVEERVYNTAQLKKSMSENMMVAREHRMDLDEIANIFA